MNALSPLAPEDSEDSPPRLGDSPEGEETGHRGLLISGRPKTPQAGRRHPRRPRAYHDSPSPARGSKITLTPLRRYLEAGSQSQESGDSQRQPHGGSSVLKSEAT